MNKIVVIFLLLSFLGSYSQQNEWDKIVEQLKKEADYFKGKKGYLRLTKQKYNTFTVDGYSIKDTLFKIETKLFDRYENVAGQEVKKQELTFDFRWDFPSIKSVEIFYNYDFYFEDYPNILFIKFEFLEEFRSDTLPVNAITLPIRRKQLEKILKTITVYQKKILQDELERERTH